MCIALCTIVALNIAHNRPDNFPPYPPDNHHCSDDVYLSEGGIVTAEMADRVVAGVGGRSLSVVDLADVGFFHL